MRPGGLGGGNEAPFALGGIIMQISNSETVAVQQGVEATRIAIKQTINKQLVGSWEAM